VNAFSHSFRRISLSDRKELLQNSRITSYVLEQKQTLLFSIISTQLFLRFICLSSAVFIFYDLSAQKPGIFHSLSQLEYILLSLVFCFLFVFFIELLPRGLSQSNPKKTCKLSKPLSSLYLLLLWPISYLLFNVMKTIFPKLLFSFFEPNVSSREKLAELITDIDDNTLFNLHDKKLFLSVLNFRDRIVREIMVPRINVFAINEDTTIRDAAKLLEETGYSRVPVYKNTQDHIVGVLMHKDISAKYIEAVNSENTEKILNTNVEILLKKVLYSPETKKISMLLQEFRKKQMHMAVVVDEYGSTAGIVTIEDILEEIVGEIADEYDDEEALYQPTNSGGWIVDARMNLLDLEEELNIKIPQESDYDTIAGYLFFRLGMIPKKGVIIHHDDFELEILKSGDRSVEKVKIIPMRKSKLTKLQED